jgi:hypothetical protein
MNRFPSKERTDFIGRPFVRRGIWTKRKQQRGCLPMAATGCVEQRRSPLIIYRINRRSRKEPNRVIAPVPCGIM